MAEVNIRVAAQDAASGPLGAVGRSARLMGADFDVADIKIATAIRHLRENGSLAAIEWGGFSTAYSAGWTIRTTAASLGDAALLALEGAQKLRGTTAGTEEAGNTVLRIKNYTDIGIAAATLNGFGSVLHGYSYVRLGQLGTWWANTRNLIVGIVDNDLGPGMGRLDGGLGALVRAAENMASGVGGAFVRMANSVVGEVGRAQSARDLFVGGLGVTPMGVIPGVVTAATPVFSAGSSLGSVPGRSFSGFSPMSQFVSDKGGDGGGWPVPKYPEPKDYGEFYDQDSAVSGDQISMGGGWPGWWDPKVQPYSDTQSGSSRGWIFDDLADPEFVPKFNPVPTISYTKMWEEYYKKYGAFVVPPDPLNVTGAKPADVPGYVWKDGWGGVIGGYVPIPGYWADPSVYSDDDPMGQQDAYLLSGILVPPGGRYPSRQRASGGLVTGGTPYMVGEQGPELFVGSGGGGRDLNVRTLNLYGVQDGAALFDVVMREARARGVGIG